jgi:hypothetical protein
LLGGGAGLGRRFGVALLVVLALAALVAAAADATPTFLTAVDVSAAGSDSFEPSIAEDASGNMLYVWTMNESPTITRIQARFRAADGTFDATQTISDPGQPASSPQVAFDPSGNAIAVWTRFDGTNGRIQAAFRPAGGSFGAAQTISAAGGDASQPQISIDSSGKAVAVWIRFDGSKERVQAAVRPASGSFGVAQTLSDAGQNAEKPRVGAGGTADSHAAVVWDRSDGVNLIVQSARRRDVPGYARPKGATPVRVPLVVAYQSCLTGNTSHGAPLSFPSCNPPVRSSSVLTVGTPDANTFAANGTGFVKYSAIVGDPNNTIDDSDVKLELGMTDVRNNPSGSDYTGRVLVTAPLQVTDRNNSQETPTPATTLLFPLQFSAPCTGTADTSIGSSCTASTTLDAIVPGAVAESNRSIWEIGQIEIKDAGPNGTGYAACPPTCGDGDETVFERQGIFIP